MSPIGPANPIASPAYPCASGHVASCRRADHGPIHRCGFHNHRHACVDRCDIEPTRRFDEHLAAQNIASARAGDRLAHEPIPFSRHIEQTNREDRFDRWRADHTPPPTPRLRLTDHSASGSAAASSLGHVAPAATPQVQPAPAGSRRSYVAEPPLPRGLTLDVLA